MDKNTSTAIDARAALDAVRAARDAVRETSDATSRLTRRRSSARQRRRIKAEITTAHARNIKRAWKDEERACRDALERENAALRAIAMEIRDGWRAACASTLMHQSTSIRDARDVAFAVRTRDVSVTSQRDILRLCDDVREACEAMRAMVPADAPRLETAVVDEDVRHARAASLDASLDAIDRIFAELARDSAHGAHALGRKLVDVAEHVERVCSSLRCNR